jgi:peptidase E
MTEELKELIEAAKEVLDRQGLNWFGLQRLRKALDAIEENKQ